MSHADKGRLIHLTKKRRIEKEDIENQLQRIEEDKARAGIQKKFAAINETPEEAIRAQTYGLVTLDELKSIQKNALSNQDLQVARGDSGPTARTAQDLEEAREKEEHVKRNTQKRVLSFAFDEAEDDDDVVPVIRKKRVGMNPDVDTSFLPDRDRELVIQRRKEELAAEWRKKQEAEKNEEMKVDYAYWDGSSHRKAMKVKKGQTIGQSIGKAIDALKREFAELRSVSSEQVMFVKEDLIIPHHYTFQDFIVSKAMGKTGPLFVFDAAADVRIRQDAALDCGESHPVKIVLRSWYTKNKHIYPASRWEPFVPSKKYARNLDDLSDL
ncbi:unnamed protein product [Caenorhabditis sp. 36 PRJEB53466]|nr:unnamed protein product [Caenorhabditis sp. 36 PRJEB53466]